MVSFITKPNGTFQVKLKGTIHYKFKGMSMLPEKATVVDQDERILVVSRTTDNTLVHFVKAGSDWLLKGNDTSESLLYGSCFTFDK